jgi:hypothetical protein
VLASTRFPVAAPASPFVVGQTWSGSYFCLQGETAAVLRVVAVESLVVRSVVEFRAETSGVTGSCAMTGTYDPGTRSITFQPGEWIKQPAGYVMIPIGGRVSASGLHFVGKVESPRCGEVSLSLPGTDER